MIQQPTCRQEQKTLEVFAKRKLGRKLGFLGRTYLQSCDQIDMVEVMYKELEEPLCRESVETAPSRLTSDLLFLFNHHLHLFRHLKTYAARFNLRFNGLP